MKLVPKEPVPKGEPITPFCMAKRIFYVVEGTRAKVYRERTLVKRFIHIHNARAVARRLAEAEHTHVVGIYNALTKERPIYIRQR